MKFELTPSVSRVLDEMSTIPNAKFWVVGGAVRDVLMDKKPKDLDLATNLKPAQVRQILLTLGFSVIPDKVAFDHGTVKFVDDETKKPVDITTLRKDLSCDGRHTEVQFTGDIKEDLGRRDLTINAMAAVIDLAGEVVEIIDPFQGQLAIHNKLISFVGHPDDRIQEDFLRSVRACRFTALGPDWKMDDHAFLGVVSHVDGLDKVSKERIRDEVTKALGYEKPSNFFRSMESTGLLKKIFPDLQKGVGVAQNEHHAEPVFDHLLRCLDYSVGLTENVLLRLATLTHDIAKPHTKSDDGKGGVHFYKHEVVGATLMYEWMRKMRFPKKDIEYVVKLVRHHQWRFQEDSHDKTIRKWLSEVGPYWRDLITLRIADRKGNLKKAHLPEVTREMRDLINRAEIIINSGAAIFKEDLAINGHDLNELGFKDRGVYKTVFNDLLGIVHADPTKNNKEWLLSHVKKVYLKEKNDNTPGSNPEG